MNTSMIGIKALPNKSKRRKKYTKKLTTSVSGIRHAYNMTQKKREIMEAELSRTWRKNLSLTSRGTPSHLSTS